MSGDLEGRVAVVTAAASGIGRETSLAFAREGAHVILIDINGDAASTVVAEIEQAGGSAEAHRVDMTSVADIRKVVARIEQKHPRLDVLYNHVGGPAPRGFDFDGEDWQRSVDLNLTAPVFMTQAGLPLMQKAGNGGSILFTSSVAGLVASPLTDMPAHTRHLEAAYEKALKDRFPDALTLLNRYGSRSPTYAANDLCPF